MSKLYYIANIRLPTEKAHGLQIMKMCEAFAARGPEVILLVPSRRNSIIQDPYDFYAVAKTFSIVYIKSPDFVKFGPVGFILGTWIFGFRAVREALRRGFDWAYSRDGRMLWLLSWSTKNFTWEIHDVQRHWWAKRVLRVCSGLVTTNRALATLYGEFAQKNIPTLVAPSAVTVDEFDMDESKVDIRNRLGLNKDKKMILYAGHLYVYKGADIAAKAAMMLPEYEFVFIGGMKTDLERFSNKYAKVKNIKILGHKQHREVAAYLRAADLLLLPNSAKDTFSALYTSPLKLFEYMASGIPIIASDLPSIREILDDSTGYFVKADDVVNLAAVVDQVLTDYEAAEGKAHRALEESRKYSYEKRAENILAFICKNNGK